MMISVVSKALLLFSLLLGTVVTVSIDDNERNEESLFGSSAVLDVENDAMIYLKDLVKASLHKSTDLSLETHARKLQETMDYIDFTKLLDPNYVDEDEFYAMLGSLLVQARTYINGNVSEGESLLINSLMQGLFSSSNNATDGSPLTIRWELPDGGYTLDLPGIDSVILKAVHIGGLDTFNMVNILNPTPDDPQIIQNQVGLDTLTFDLELTEMSGDNGETTDSVIGLVFKNVTISVPLLLVVEKTAFESIPVGALLYSEYFLPCLNASVNTVEISSFDMEFETIEQPTTSVTTSPVFQLIQTVVVTLPATVPALFDAILRPIVNNMLQNSINSATTSCPNAITPSAMTTEDGFVDLHTFFQQGLPSILRSFLDNQILEVDPNTGLAVMNTMFVDPWTFNQSGVEGMLMLGAESAPLVNFHSGISIGGLEADIQLRLDNLKIENLNTMKEPLEFLKTMASDPFLLDNTATMGLSLDERPLSLSTEVFVSIDTADGKISNTVGVEIDMEAMNVVVVALLKVLSAKLFAFPIRDITNLNCWLATIPAPALDPSGVRLAGEDVTAGLADFSGSFGDVNLNISCIQCSSPRMADFTDLLLTTDAQESFKTSMNKMMDGFIGRLLSDMLQFHVDRMLNEAMLLCPHHPDYNPEALIEYEQLQTSSQTTDVTFVMLFGIVILVVIVLTAGVMLVVKVIVRRRHRRFIFELPKEQKIRLMHSQTRNEILEKELNVATTSLFHSPEIPFILRWTMPVILLGSIGLFLSGHLSLGASVNIEAQVAGDLIRVDKFYEFSVANATIDVWNAGGKALAILILIFSGIWPYTKQLITIVVWFLPPSILSVSTRGSLLLWLDWLAKWSMIDIFVVVVSIASFRVSIQSPGVGFLPENFYSINLLVVPLWGLYSNMTAQLVSQISSHVIIHYHRKVVSKGTSYIVNNRQLTVAPGEHDIIASNVNPSSGPEEKRVLRYHQFGRPHRGEEERLVVMTWVCYVLVVLATIVVALVIVGCILPSLSVEILGVIGLAVELGQDFTAATTEHSVFTILQLFMAEARFLDNTRSYIGLGALSCLFVFTVLVVPIVQSFTLLRQWFAPMTRRQRIRTSIRNGILQAWQYIEVYVVALFVACWQLGPISEFMFNTSCSQFDGFFAQMAQFGILKAEDAQCFRVEGFIEPGSIVLAVAAAILTLLNTFVNKAVAQYFYDKKSELEKKLFPDDGISDLGATSGSDIELSEQAAKNLDTEKIHPVPVLFSDTFRWLLMSESRSETPASGEDTSALSPNAENGNTALSPEEQETVESGVINGVERALTESNEVNEEAEK